MYLGISDLLSEPTRGPNELCQCWSYKCKKITLLLTLFAFTISLAILVLLLWTRLGFIIPVEIAGIMVILQFITFVFIVIAFFNEKKYRLFTFSIIVNFFALFVYIILAIIYLVILIRNKMTGKGGEIGNYNRSIFLPGIPSYGIGNTAIEGMTQNEQTLHLLAHAMFLIPIQLFICYVLYAVYVIFKRKSKIQYPSKPPKVYYARNEKPFNHNVVVMESHINDVLYDPRKRQEMV